jgi:hypothetical protein
MIPERKIQHRDRSDSHHRRPRQILFHVSDEEQALLAAAAEREYLPLPAWVRMVVLKRANGET